LGTMWRGVDQGAAERRMIPNFSSSAKWAFAVACCSGARRRGRAVTGGPVVWMWWDVVWVGVGQEVAVDEVIVG